MESGKKRVQAPNKEKFQKDLEQLEQELKTKEKDLAIARDNAKKVQSGGGNNDERKNLLNEVNQLKKRQSELKAQRLKIMDEVKMIDERNKKKIKDLAAQKAKVNFKNVDEIDAQIKKLEKSVDAGNMRLVEEKQALGEISALKKAKKNFGTFNDAQAAIDSDRAKIQELKNSIDKTEADSVSERFNEVMAQLNAMRDEQSAAYKNKTELFNKRAEAEASREEVRKKMKELKDSYYSQVRSYNEQRKADQTARAEREKSERIAKEKEKKLADAKEKMEAAAEPAFAAEIATAKNLLIYFDPEYKKTGEVDNNNKDDKFAAKATRTIDNAMPEGAKVIKKGNDEFFTGNAGKKAKGKKQNSSDKFTMDLSIIDDLSKLNIGVPSGKDDVPKTIESLKAKIADFKENQEKVTAERMAKAKADLEKLEAQEAEEAKENVQVEVEA